MGKHAGGEGKVAGQIFPPQPAVNLAGILESGQGDLGDFLVGQGLGDRGDADFLSTDLYTSSSPE
jgi:hypothetical protein